MSFREVKSVSSSTNPMMFVFSRRAVMSMDTVHLRMSFGAGKKGENWRFYPHGINGCFWFPSKVGSVAYIFSRRQGL